jgi:hypothetical protein
VVEALERGEEDNNNNNNNNNINNNNKNMPLKVLGIDFFEF